MVLSGLRDALALVLSLPTALEQQDLLTDIVYGVILGAWILYQLWIQSATVTN